MAVLTYADYSLLASTTFTVSGGEFYGTTLTHEYDEVIEFGICILFDDHKEIECNYIVNKNISTGILYVPEFDPSYFILNGVYIYNGDFDLTGGVLKIYTLNSNIYTEYV